MKTGIAVIQDNVAVNFDSSDELVVFDCNGNTETFKKPWQPGEFIDLLVKKEVFTLLCGGIKRSDMRFLILNGIDVIPWVRGSVKDVIDAFCGNNFVPEKFFMPGGRRFRRRWGRNF